MTRFGYQQFTNEKECNPSELNKMCIMRGDGAFIETKKDLLDICTKCDNVEKCSTRIKEIKARFFTELNNKYMG